MARPLSGTSLKKKFGANGGGVCVRRKKLDEMKAVKKTYQAAVEKTLAKGPERKENSPQAEESPWKAVHPRGCTECGLPAGCRFSRNIRIRAVSSRTCIAGVSGRCASMRFATAEASNERYRYLLNQGTTGLSVAFDLPTQIGYDSDHSMAQGEVGKVGVAIDSLADMEILLTRIRLIKFPHPMTIDRPCRCALGDVHRRGRSRA